MSNYDKVQWCQAAINNASLDMQEALAYLDGINPDGGKEVTTITPLRFEAAYRALSRHLGRGHDHYDQWTPAGQRSHRGYARAVLEGAGFTVREEAT